MEISYFVYFCLTFIGLSHGVYQEKYTQAELRALENFRPLVKGLVQNDFEKKDIYLIHWLRAKDLNLNAAKSMLQQNLNWRKENKIETIASDEEILKLIKLYPAGLGVAKDKVGRPGAFVAYAEWDVRKGILSGHNLNRYNVYSFENMTRQAFEAGQSQWMWIVDMNQYNLRQHACLACVGFYIELVNNYEKYFPNTAHAILLINTPRIFEQILSVITPLFSAHTRKVLKVLGVDKTEWQGIMLKHFDAGSLTRQYGGNKLYF